VQCPRGDAPPPSQNHHSQRRRSNKHQRRRAGGQILDALPGGDLKRQSAGLNGLAVDENKGDKKDCRSARRQSLHELLLKFCLFRTHRRMDPY